MRLRTKIIIGFFCISLLLAFIGILSDNFTGQVRQEQLKYVQEASQVVIFTGEMEKNLYQSLIFLNVIRESMGIEQDFSSVPEVPPVSELKPQLEKELEQFEQGLHKLENVLGRGKEVPANVGKLRQSYEVYKSISEEWLKLGNDDYDQANLMFITSIEPYFRNNIIPHISELRTYVLNIQNTRSQELDASLQKVDMANNIATVVSILLAIGLAIYIYSSIANPLVKLNHAVNRLGEGKLDERIEVHSNDELGELARAFNQMAEGLEQKTVSKAYVDNIIESINEAIFVTDAGGRLIRFNTAASSLLGYNPDEILNQPLNRYINTKATEMKVAEPKVAYEFSVIRGDDEQIPVLYSEADLRDNQGKFAGQVVVASDISKQKHLEAELRSSLREKEVMLAEIHHRVKNNLAVISGLLQLQSYSAGNKEVEKALTDSQLRIQSIALVHEMLYENESLAYIQYDIYINDLLQAISSMYISEDKNIELISDVEPIKLTINQAIPCSLLLNELVVNLFKHAFKKQDEGKIIVSLKQAGQKVLLTVSDTGGGFDRDKFNSSDSLDSMLIKTLSKQIKGKFEIIPKQEGKNSYFRIEFKREN